MALWGFYHHVLAINAINICIQYVWMSFLSHTLFLWALKCGGSAFCAERDTSCRLMLCLLFWSGSQRAVVVHCWFSIHACPSLSTLNELQHPPWTQTYLYHQLWAGSKCALLSLPIQPHSLTHVTHANLPFAVFSYQLICHCPSLSWSLTVRVFVCLHIQ